jgi:acid-sensing ion channel, other
LVKRLKDSEEEQEKIVPFLHKLTRMTYENMDEAVNTLSNISDIASLQSESLRNWLFSVVIECSEIFTRCRYRGDTFSCCDIFYPVYSERGFCFGFNARTNDSEENE